MASTAPGTRTTGKGAAPSPAGAEGKEDSGPEWLVLVHLLPPGASNPRVKIWRRLQALGAVSLRSAVYVLPNTAQSREDFAWVREEIHGLKGHATILTADTLDPVERQALVDAFRSARAADFARLRGEIERATRPLLRAKRPAAARPGLDRTIRAYREQLAAVEALDFFSATGAAEARAALQALEAHMPRTRDVKTATDGATADLKGYTGKVWVTRPRPGVDRMASAWLIRRYVDPKAKFAFAERPAGSQVPFDMFTGEFSHQGLLCTFEVLARRFGLAQQEVRRIGQIVHDLDMKETRYDPPEAAAVGRMVEGLRQVHAEDQALLQQGIAMFEALARSFERSS